LSKPYNRRCTLQGPTGGARRLSEQNTADELSRRKSIYDRFKALSSISVKLKASYIRNMHYQNIFGTAGFLDALISPEFETTAKHNVGFEILTEVTMKNTVFWDIKSLFVPHRKRITSPLQSPAG
jgi:hypothetical protein